MDKNFDQWNLLKKNINASTAFRLYRTRDIWWCSLGANVGFEQDGSGKYYERPVLILRGLSRRVCVIVPLTTSQKKNPYRISVGLVSGKEAYAAISQVRLIDTRRLINKVGVLEIIRFEIIRKAVKNLL